MTSTYTDAGHRSHERRDSRPSAMTPPATKPAAMARTEQRSVVAKPRAKIGQFWAMTDTSNVMAALVRLDTRRSAARATGPHHRA